MEQASRPRLSKLALAPLCLWPVLHEYLFWSGRTTWDGEKLLISKIYWALAFGLIGVVCGHFARFRIRRISQSLRGSKWAAVSLFVSYIGMAMLVFLLFWAPSNLEQSMRVRCYANLRNLKMSAKAWCDDGNDCLPKNFLDMTNYIGNPEIVVCPADPKHDVPHFYDDTHWYPSIRWVGERFSPTNVSYEFLTPGRALSNVSNQVVFRCPIHGFEVFGRDIAAVPDRHH